MHHTGSDDGITGHVTSYLKHRVTGKFLCHDDLANPFPSDMAVVPSYPDESHMSTVTHLFYLERDRKDLLNSSTRSVSKEAGTALITPIVESSATANTNRGGSEKVATTSNASDFSKTFECETEDLQDKTNFR